MKARCFLEDGAWSFRLPPTGTRALLSPPASAGRTAASQQGEPLGRQVTSVPQRPCPLLTEHSGCPPASSQVCPLQSGFWSSPCTPHSVQGQALLTCLLSSPPPPACPGSSSLPLPFTLTYSFSLPSLPCPPSFLLCSPFPLITPPPHPPFLAPPCSSPSASFPFFPVPLWILFRVLFLDVFSYCICSQA